MPLSRQKKEELVTQYTELLQNSRALFVTDYRGLNTSDLTRLRREVVESDAQFLIIKNRLFRLAMQNAGLDIPKDFLNGPVAAGFCFGEVPPVAKALTEFARGTEILVVKGGLLDEKFLTRAEVNALADLPPLEVMRAQLLGLLDAPAANIAGVMASSVRQVVNVLAAYADKGEGPSNGDAPAAEAAVESAAQEAEEEVVEAQAEAEEEASAEEATDAVAEAQAQEEAPAEEATDATEDQ